MRGGRALANLLRYGRLFAEFWWLRKRVHHPVHVCLSVDVDPWLEEPPIHGCEAIEMALARRGLSGRVTYLINPCCGLERCAATLEQLARDGNEIGLHCHQEAWVLAGDAADIEAAIEAEKAAVESFFRRWTPAFSVQTFRSGSRAFSPALFEALARLGLRYDSTLAHRRQVRELQGHRLQDGLTPGRAFYLSPADPTRESSDPTPLVEIPVSSQIPNLRGLISALRPGEPLLIATFVHPYNFHRNGRRRWMFQTFYAFVLFCLTRLPEARFSHLSEAGRAWEAWFASHVGSPTPITHGEAPAAAGANPFAGAADTVKSA